MVHYVMKNNLTSSISALEVEKGTRFDTNSN